MRHAGSCSPPLSNHLSEVFVVDSAATQVFNVRDEPEFQNEAGLLFIFLGPQLKNERFQE